MPFLFEDYDTITLTHGETAKIVRQFNQGHLLALQDAVSRGINIGFDGDTVRLRDMNAAQMMVASKYTSILIAVKEWSFKDRDGNVAPVTEEWIKMLDPRDFDILVAEIEKRNDYATGRTKAEKEPDPGMPGEHVRARRNARRA